MSADFLLATCPAPLARITYTAPTTATSVTYLDVAPEEVWREPFRNWLMQPDTINRILADVDPFSAHVDSWAELIEDRIDGKPSQMMLASAPGLTLLSMTLSFAMLTPTPTHSVPSVKSPTPSLKLHIRRLSPTLPKAQSTKTSTSPLA